MPKHHKCWLTLEGVEIKQADALVPIRAVGPGALAAVVAAAAPRPIVLQNVTQQRSFAFGDPTGMPPEQFKLEDRDSPPVVEHSFRSGAGGCFVVVCVLAGLTFLVASHVPHQFSLPTFKAGIAAAIAITTLWYARATVGYSLSMFWHWMHGTPIIAVCVQVRLSYGTNESGRQKEPHFSGSYEYDYGGVRYRIHELEQGFKPISTGDRFVVHHIPDSASPGMRVRAKPMLWRFACGSTSVVIFAFVACKAFQGAWADFRRLLDI